MKKVYKKLSAEQKAEGIIFTSTLSKFREEQSTDRTHKVYATDADKWETIERLKDDKFFNKSPWSFNIIRGA
jgi:hypothetical protein